MTRPPAGRAEPVGATAAAVIVFGECLVDRYPEQAVAGGAPFNVARHLAAFGLDPYFISRVGNDADGRQLLAECTRFGLRRDGIQVDPCLPSGQVLVHRGDSGHDFEIRAGQAYDAIERVILPPALQAAGPRRGWLYFGTLAQRAAPSRDALEDLRARWPHRAFVDLNWRAGQVAPALALDMLDRADTLKLSDDELRLLLSWRRLQSAHTAAPPPPGTVCPGIAALLAQRRVAQLIVTHGAAGYSLWMGAGRCALSGPGMAQTNVADTVGAGDAFSAVALAGLLLDWPLARTLERANAFAAAICGVRGAMPARADFHQGWARQWREPPRAGQAERPHPEGP